MKSTVTILYKISFSLILIFAINSNLFSQDYEKDKQEIRQRWYDMGKELINKNWDEYQNYWVQDTTINVIHSSEKDWIQGWHDVQKRYKAICESDVNMDNFRMPKADVFDVYIAPGGEFAWAVIEQRIFSEEVEIIHAWYMLVYRKIDGKWLVNGIFDATIPSEQNNED